ncbi:cystinosin homolog [Oppia nitens]|uniref:cystinosin homolog n=1 Tax=Oppia nitens TaxID=1686743 RepID=UPI0023DBFEB9|nr:cystinosin homolog [Oppia nitens]
MLSSFSRLTIVWTQLLLLLLLVAINGQQLQQQYKNSLIMNTKDVQINVGDEGSFILFIEKPPPTGLTVNVSIGCDGSDECHTFTADDNYTIPANNLLFTSQTTEYRFRLRGLNPGHDVIVATVVTNQSGVDDSDAFVRVRVGRSRGWAIAADVVGWIYFLVWSASFWPQNITNWRRKSVIGFNLDFAALNVTGFVFYTFYNSGLYFSTRVRELYEIHIPRSEIPIQLNDVIYAIHAAAVTGITLVQCYVYERGDQRMSLLGKLFTGGVWSAAAVQLILCLVGVESWLTFLYYFSYVKLTVTSVKYIPQAYFNYKRKSTDGWSIAMIYMDITGGVNGLLQMIFIAYNYDDWKTIFGNIAKFGLSIASISYDILFFLQEYVFYRNPPKQESTETLANGGGGGGNDYHRKVSGISSASIGSVMTQSGNDRLNGKRKSIVSIISAKSMDGLRAAFSEQQFHVN